MLGLKEGGGINALAGFAKNSCGVLDTASFNFFSCLFFPSFLADISPETRANVKFVQDTSKYWYKPEISREQGG